MRHGRIKIPAAKGEAYYHCVTRTVNKEFLFDAPALEVLRHQLRQVADYCGVQVLTHALMANHFHVLARVPRQEPVIANWRTVQATLKAMQQLSRSVLFTTLPGTQRRKRLSKSVLGMI